MSETNIEIVDLKEEGMWVQYTHEDRPIWKEPFAGVLRRYLDSDPKNDDRGERAFSKLALSKIFKNDLMRA